MIFKEALSKTGRSHSNSYLGAEQVFDIAQVSKGAIDHEAIWHAAGLRALTPVGRPAAPGL